MENRPRRIRRTAARIFDVFDREGDTKSRYLVSYNTTVAAFLNYRFYESEKPTYTDQAGKVHTAGLTTTRHISELWREVAPIGIASRDDIVYRPQAWFDLLAQALYQRDSVAEAVAALDGLFAPAIAVIEERQAAERSKQAARNRRRIELEIERSAFHWQVSRRDPIRNLPTEWYRWVSYPDGDLKRKLVVHWDNPDASNDPLDPPRWSYTIYDLLDDTKPLYDGEALRRCELLMSPGYMSSFHAKRNAEIAAGVRYSELAMLDGTQGIEGIAAK